MKVKLQTYLDPANGLALKLVPENEIERELIRGLVNHARMELVDGELSLMWDFKKKEEK